MREHKISWLVTDRQTENAKVEASLNLRFAESGTKKKERKGKKERVLRNISTQNEIGGKHCRPNDGRAVC